MNEIEVDHFIEFTIFQYISYLYSRKTQAFPMAPTLLEMRKTQFLAPVNLSDEKLSFCTEMLKKGTEDYSRQQFFVYLLVGLSLPTFHHIFHCISNKIYFSCNTYIFPYLLNLSELSHFMLSTSKTVHPDTWHIHT